MVIAGRISNALSSVDDLSITKTLKSTYDSTGPHTTGESTIYPLATPSGPHTKELYNQSHSTPRGGSALALDLTRADNHKIVRRSTLAGGHTDTLITSRCLRVYSLPREGMHARLSTIVLLPAWRSSHRLYACVYVGTPCALVVHALAIAAGSMPLYVASQIDQITYEYTPLGLYSRRLCRGVLILQ